MAVLRDIGRQRLAFDHLCEFASELIQRVVSALFNDVAFFQDEDGVAVFDCGQAVDYEDYGLVAAQVVYAALDFYFGFGVMWAL